MALMRWGGMRERENEIVARVDLSRIPKEDVSVYIIGDMLACYLW